MTPRMRPNLPPRFAEEMNESDFEVMSRDLFAKEPNIRSCELYGRRGQGQRGIDTLAYCSDGDAIEVGQSKRVAQFEASLVTEVVDKFIEDLKHWKAKKVRRFILFVASPIRDTETQDTIVDETARLGKSGIIFEVWDADRIYQKLKPWPDIVENHCGPYWVQTLCGNTVDRIVGGTLPQILSGMDGGRALLVDCAVEFNDTYDEELSRLRELTRSGRRHEAEEQLKGFIESPRWRLLSLRHKALGLRLAASLSFDHSGDLARTKSLLEKAKANDPNENYQSLDALIVYREKGREAALHLLSEPRDLDVWNLKLAFLVEAGRGSEVLQASESPDFSPNGETFRILAIAALLSNKFERAQFFISEAVRLNPSWLHVRILAAKIKYLETVLPNFPMRAHLDWPVPPDWEFVRRDTESLENLKIAENEFRDLISFFEDDVGEKAKIEGWLLACIANNAERRSEAEAYALSLLDGNPSHQIAAIWSLQRGFRVNAEILQKHFSEQRSEALTSDSAQLLCTLHIGANRYEEALSVLEKARGAFEAVGTLFAWRLVKAQVLAELGHQEEAEKFIQEEPDAESRREMQIAILRMIARKTHNFEKLAAAITKAYEETRDPGYLFEACEVALNINNPQFIADHAEELLFNYPTSSGLQLAIQGCFEANQFSTCLKMLRQHKGYFPNGQISAAMRRVEIECLRQVGELAAAVEHAQELVQKHRDTASLLSLFQVQVSLNNFSAIVTTTRELLKRDDVPTLALLQAAQAVHIEDDALALECWEEAIRRGDMDPAALQSAVSLAFRLGIEKAAAPLMPQFFALANSQESDLEIKSFEDFKEFAIQASERQEEINRKFNECQLPVHMAIKGLGCSLGTLYHEKPTEASKEGHPLLHYPLMARHGARTQVANPKISAGVLFADVTAVMLAAEIGVLDLAEKAFGPIIISAHLPECIRSQIEAAAPNQPALEERRKAVADLVEQKRISTIPLGHIPAELAKRYASEIPEESLALMSFAQREGALVCTFVPSISLSGVPVVFEQPELEIIISCGDIIASLEYAGAISSDEARDARKRIGFSGASTSTHSRLTPGRALILTRGIAEQLAHAEILETIASFARLTLSEDEFRTISAARVQFSREMQNIQWLKSLAVRLQRGIENNIYITKTASLPLKGSDHIPQNPEEHCLFDLLAAKEFGASITWCDDRFMSRYLKVSDLPNYGFSEVLRKLRTTGRINDSGYFDVLLKLRERNVRYFPLEADELRYHIARAPVIDEQIKETPALTTIRRYFAACCLDKARMLPPTEQNGRQILGEYTWFSDSLRATAQTLAKLWENAKSEEDVHARAEWILNNLIIPTHGVAETQSGLAQPNNGLDGMAATFAMLFACGFTLQSPWKRNQEDFSHSRAKYWHWLGARLVDPTIQVEPGIIAQLVKFLADGWLKQKRKKPKNKTEGQVLRGLATRAWLDLPKSLQLQMNFSDEEKKYLGLGKAMRILGTFGREFDADIFWRSVAKALKDGTAKLPTRDAQETYDISAPKEDNLRGIYFSGPNLARGHLVEAKAKILKGDHASRRRYLERKFDWFDFDLDRRKKEVLRILSITDAGKRIRELDDIKDVAVEEHYRALYRRLKNHEGITPEECLPPSAIGLCDHFRLQNEVASIKENLNVSAQNLLDDVGIASTIKRFATLPILLPEPIVRAVKKLPARSLHGLLLRLRPKLHSPLSRLHLVHLLTIGSATDAALLDEAKTIPLSLIDEKASRERWTTFATILEWCRRSFQILPEFRSLSAPRRLLFVWSHSTRIHNIFLRSGVEDKSLQQAFRNSTERTSIDISAVEFECWQDASHPRFAGRLPVVLRGLGTILKHLPKEVAKEFQLAELPWKAGVPTSGLMLLHDTNLGYDSLESFLGGDSFGPLREVFNEETLNSILPIEPPQVLRQAITELQVNSGSPENWHLLNATAGDSPLSQNIENEIEALINSTDFHKMLEDKSDYDQVVFMFVCGRAVHGWSEQTRQHIDDQFWKLVGHFKKSSTDEAQLYRRINMIATCSIYLSVKRNDRAETFHQFYKRLTEVVRRWPDAAALFRRRFEGWPTGRPLDGQRGLWEFELTLRGLS